MNLLNKFKDPKLCLNILEQVKHEIQGQFRFMEVCGTHTVAIFQSGIRTLLPENIVHLSGPGCPVCVTHDREIAAYLELAEKNVIIATFGDLIKVPGPGGRNLKMAQAEGARIQVVYSAFDALQLAMQNPQDKVVFLGVGFETTAPTVAATVKMAKEKDLDNFSVLSFHKLVPPALKALASDKDIQVDGLLLPGHVSTVIGLDPYLFLTDEYNMPAVIGGFEPLDILQAILIMIRQKSQGHASVINNYKRVVNDAGNLRALQVMREVFETSDAMWRGLGVIPESGLALRKDFENFNAFIVHEQDLPDVKNVPGCKCGDVLKGLISPDKCPLFGIRCTPASPVGPCMVSTEGSCAAYHKYSI
ncbi:hydrogenase formation protein HypD [Desulfonatronovibrio magnus]|uniref:hydrogenase formation protein HypD n=1 Tax=Desulfonatronovibrio magnus TaxID=698827 RepID=UPI000B1C8BD2|nr:hydrogenase formation protein HypD [Desulfonatronovibrio magnus]